MLVRQCLVCLMSKALQTRHDAGSGRYLGVHDLKARLKISAVYRFDAAYKVIMQLANAAFHTNGYRPLTSKSSYRMTMIQTLGQTIGLDKQTIILLDDLRKQRNVADYSGDIVPLSAVEDCVCQEENLLQHLTRRLKANQPDVFK